MFERKGYQPLEKFFLFVAAIIDRNMKKHSTVLMISVHFWLQWDISLSEKRNEAARMKLEKDQIFGKQGNVVLKEIYILNDFAGDQFLSNTGRDVLLYHVGPWDHSN